MDIVLHKRFWINQLIDAGTHGQVFDGFDTKLKQNIAVKIVPEAKLSISKFNREITVIKKLNEVSDIGFTQLVFKGKWKKYNYYVMSKLGSSLKALRDLTYSFSLENVLMVSLQLLRRIKTLHSINYVHRDIKQANLLFGIGDSINTLHLIDFGLTKKASRFSGEIPKEIFEKDLVSLSGTPNYASINLHSGWDLCFKTDDIESMLYLIIHLIKGKLPWEQCRTDDNYYE